MKLATSIGDVYSFTRTPAEAVRFFEGTGFRYLDYDFCNVIWEPDHPFMGEDWMRQIVEARQAADTLGFSFVQAHAPTCVIGDGMDVEWEFLAAKRAIEACGYLGIRNMVMHSGCFSEIKYPEGQQQYFQATYRFFKRLIPYMEANNVSILLENTTSRHWADRVYGCITAQDLNELIAYFDHPLFGAGWDVGHAHLDALDQHEQIMTLGKNLKALHIHDNDGMKDHHTLPFTGTMNFDSLMRGLIETGYEGFFTFESGNFLKYNRDPALTGPLAHPTPALKKAALSLLYLTGKTILDAYGLYEE